MKKIFPILILILILVSCKSKKVGTELSKPKFELGIDVFAKVSRIDSIANYYLVFIENEEEFFKIVSDKNQAKYYNGIKVEIGDNYKFRIQQVTDRRPPGPNDRFTPVNYLDIAQCRNFDKIEICTESSFELATAIKSISLKWTMTYNYFISIRFHNIDESKSKISFLDY